MHLVHEFEMATHTNEKPNEIFSDFMHLMNPFSATVMPQDDGTSSASPE